MMKMKKIFLALSAVVLFSSSLVASDTFAGRGPRVKRGASQLRLNRGSRSKSRKGRYGSSKGRVNRVSAPSVKESLKQGTVKESEAPVTNLSVIKPAGEAVEVSVENRSAVSGVVDRPVASDALVNRPVDSDALIDRPVASDALVSRPVVSGAMISRPEEAGVVSKARKYKKSNDILKRAAMLGEGMGMLPAASQVEAAGQVEERRNDKPINVYGDEKTREEALRWHTEELDDILDTDEELTREEDYREKVKKTRVVKKIEDVFAPNMVERTRKVLKKIARAGDLSPEALASLKEKVDRINAAHWAQHNGDGKAFDKGTLDYAKAVFYNVAECFDVNDANIKIMDENTPLENRVIIADGVINAEKGLVSYEKFCGFDYQSMLNFIEQAKVIKDCVFNSETQKLAYEKIDPKFFNGLDVYGYGYAASAKRSLESIVRYFKKGGTFDRILQAFDDINKSRENYNKGVYEQYYNEAKSRLGTQVDVVEEDEKYTVEEGVKKVGTREVEVEEEYDAFEDATRVKTLDDNDKIAYNLLTVRKRNSDEKLYYYIAGFYAPTDHDNFETSLTVTDSLGLNHYIYVDNNGRFVCYNVDSGFMVPVKYDVRFPKSYCGLVESRNGKTARINMLEVVKKTRSFGRALSYEKGPMAYVKEARAGRNDYYDETTAVNKNSLVKLMKEAEEAEKAKKESERKKSIQR